VPGPPTSDPGSGVPQRPRAATLGCSPDSTVDEVVHGEVTDQHRRLPMSMYLPNSDVGPTGVEPVEFLELDDLSTLRAPDRSAPLVAAVDAEGDGNGADRP